MAYKITETRVLFVYRMNDDRKGYLKVSDFFVDNDLYEIANEEDLKELAYKYVKGEGEKPGKTYANDWNIEVLYATHKTYTDEEQQLLCVTAKDVHEVLSNSLEEKDVRYFDKRERGNPKDLWFKTDLDTIQQAVRAVTNRQENLSGTPLENSIITINFRPEQEKAISDAISKLNSAKKGDKKQYLWNAKMRFGKTLCALEVVRRQNYKTTLIVTHRPVVGDGWKKDFAKIFSKNNNGGTDEDGNSLVPYVYGTRMIEDNDSGGDFYGLTRNAEQTHLVFFVSMQYLRLSTLVNDRNEADDNQLKKDILQYDWDFVVVDEAHEGTRTDLGARVIDMLRKENTRMLHLSGTPFNIFGNFKEDEIYTWDYVSEQQAKRRWDDLHYGDPNPYDVLPQMKILTYELSELSADYGGDSYEGFKFSDFFRVWSGKPKEDKATMSDESLKGKFIHEDDVKMFLNKLVNGAGEKFPYASDVYPECFQHTLWIVPGVKQAAALQELLERKDDDNIFRFFKVVNVAGEASDEENYKALERVEKAINEHNYTITLSCGRLTTGVSIPQWTAVFYMSGSETTTASSFMQAIFRCQTHAVMGTSAAQKRYCYVFDFAPERTLKVVAETAKISVAITKDGLISNQDQDKDQDKNKESNIDVSDDDLSRAQMDAFLELCPIKLLGGEGQMTDYNTENLFAQLKKVRVERAVLSGFADDSIYNMDAMLNLDPDLLEKIGKITGKLTKFKVGAIHRGRKPLTQEQKNKARQARENERKGKVLTKEEKDALEAARKVREEKKNRASCLRALALRIPLMMYGAELANGEVITVDNFTDDRIVDDASWNEFMPTGITKELFNEIKSGLDPDVFREAGERYQIMVRKADELDVEDRIEKITTIFSYFHNPDKETVLTPWRVVNMHMSETLGGACFFNERFDGPNTELDNEGNEFVTNLPRWVPRGKVSEDIFENQNARILEINSKTGLYPLYMAYSMYLRRVKPAYDSEGLLKDKTDNYVAWDQVLKDNLFVVCRTPMAASITRRTLGGFRDYVMNVKCYSGDVPLNDLVKAGIIKKNDPRLTCTESQGPNTKRRVETYYYDGEATKACDIVDTLRANPKIFEQDVVKGRDFWEVYEQIQLNDKENLNNMKFNAIVGNPPYQLSDGSKTGAIPVYQHFVNAAKKLEPHFISMIMPAKWFNAGRNLDDFRKSMLEDTRIRSLYDFISSKDCFDHVDIAGGVCYFLWDRNYKGKCDVVSCSNGKKIHNMRVLNEFETFIRYNDAISILNKVRKKTTKFLDKFVNSQKPFGLRTYVSPLEEGDITLRYSGGKGKYDSSLVSANQDKINDWKVITTHCTNEHAGETDKEGRKRLLSTTEILKPGEICTETYLVIDFLKSEQEAKNLYSYIKTKFARFLLSLATATQSLSKSNFKYVPALDFSRSWSDEDLYNEYNILPHEIALIDSLIKPMD